MIRLQAHSNKCEFGNYGAVAKIISHQYSYEAARSAGCCRTQLPAVSKPLQHSHISKALSQHFLWHPAISIQGTARSVQGPPPNYQVLGS